MNRWRGNVPFLRETGDMLNYSSPRKPGVDWIPSDEWVDTLLLVGTVRSGHAVSFIWRSELSGITYSMFLSDMFDLVKTADIQLGGVVTGTWGFTKKGEKYGIYFVK